MRLDRLDSATEQVLNRKTHRRLAGGGHAAKDHGFDLLGRGHALPAPYLNISFPFSTTRSTVSPPPGRIRWTGVDPVSWTLHPLGEEESRCRKVPAGSKWSTRRSLASS